MIAIAQSPRHAESVGKLWLGSVAALLSLGGANDALAQTALYQPPPACWTQPRVFHSGAPKAEQAARIRLTATPDTAQSGIAVTSPNGAYRLWVEQPDMSRPGPWSARLVVDTQSQALPTLSATDIGQPLNPRWLNEKLIFARIALSRTVSTDVIWDVETNTLVYQEVVNDGTVAFAQAQKACNGPCPCADTDTAATTGAGSDRDVAVAVTGDRAQDVTRPTAAAAAPATVATPQAVPRPPARPAEPPVATAASAIAATATMVDTPPAAARPPARPSSPPEPIREPASPAVVVAPVVTDSAPAPMSAPNRDEAIGLLSLPNLFGSGQGQPPPRGGAPVLVYISPSAGARTIGEIRQRNDVQYDEIGYEAGAVVVYDVEGDWYEVRLRRDGRRDAFLTGWIRQGEDDRFYTNAELLQNRFGYLNALWDGRVWSEPDANGRLLRASAGANRESGGRERAARIIEARNTPLGLWVKVALYRNSPCASGDQTVELEGWVPAYSGEGKRVVWYWSRGC